MPLIDFTDQNPDEPYCKKCNNWSQNCECCLIHGDPECGHKECN